jgi:hypothetical protein
MFPGLPTLPDRLRVNGMAGGLSLAGDIAVVLFSLAFVRRFGWAATLLLATAALLAAAVAALAPDVLRCVAGMTYAHPRFGGLPSGSTLDGVKRAKLLRNVRVRIDGIRGDIRSDRNVGRVAFVALDDIEKRQLAWTRCYA